MGTYIGLSALHARRGGGPPAPACAPGHAIGPCPFAFPHNIPTHPSSLPCPLFPPCRQDATDTLLALKNKDTKYYPQDTKTFWTNYAG